MRRWRREHLAVLDIVGRGLLLLGVLLLKVINQHAHGRTCGSGSRANQRILVWTRHRDKLIAMS